MGYSPKQLVAFRKLAIASKGKHGKGVFVSDLDGGLSYLKRGIKGTKPPRGSEKALAQELDLDSLAQYEVAPVAIRAIPKTEGVYFIYYMENLVYIGSATSLRSRLLSHEIITVTQRLPGAKPDTLRISFIDLPKGMNLVTLEYALIWRFKPCMNVKKHRWDIGILNNKRGSDPIDFDPPC